MNIKQRLLETRSMIYDVFNVGKPSTASPARNYDAAGYIQYQTLTSWSNIINGFTGNSPVSDSYVRSVIHCIANYATKLQMQHIIRMPDGRYDVIDDDITYMLNRRPNKYMTAAMFNYKIYETALDRIDVETGEILSSNIATTEYVEISREVSYKEIGKNKIRKRLIIKYKHNGQTTINF